MWTNPQDQIVFIGSTQPQASLTSPIASHHFAFNPDEVKWSFSNNTVSRDTVGGRVVQLLSSKVEQMTVVGRAGSRGELQRLAQNLKKIMEYQIKTQNAVHFKVPSRKWNFKVYIQNVSSLGWDYSATSYPYEIALMIQEDLTGLSSKAVEKEALSRLAQGIGYTEKYHGGSVEEALSMSEAYLNSATFLKNKGRDDLGGPGDDFSADGTPVGDGAVPEYGKTATHLANGVDYYGKIPEITFQNFLKDVPTFVFNNPYLYKWSKNGGTAIFQKDAMLSFIQVVSDAGMPWISNVGTFRTYEQQARAYAEKPNVAAPPGKSYHELGIAIDVSAEHRNLSKVINAFSSNGWHRFSPSDEPWHWSYVVTG